MPLQTQQVPRMFLATGGLQDLHGEGFNQQHKAGERRHRVRQGPLPSGCWNGATSPPPSRLYTKTTSAQRSSNIPSTCSTPPTTAGRCRTKSDRYRKDIPLTHHYQSNSGYRIKEADAVYASDYKPNVYRGPSSPVFPLGTKPHFSSTFREAVFPGSVSASTAVIFPVWKAHATAFSTASVA